MTSNHPTRPSRSTATTAAYTLFPTAIFASAFLIFLVQPMVGKHILPWFGGSPGVWNLCLAFYQSTLFLGYAYAHCLIRLVPERMQIIVHGLLLIAAVAVLPVLPGAEWKPQGLDEPNSRILSMLVSSVAPPFLALASTGPLVQTWFARRFPAYSPYPLYAVSNVGSLLALVAYPFFVEPRLDLSAQSSWWSTGFTLTAVTILVCSWLARSDDDHPGPADAADPGRTDSGTQPTPACVALWLLLPSGAVVLLMGTTNELCQDVASVPFLWIVPLAIYLLSFIASFSSERFYRRDAFGALGAAGLLIYFVIGEWEFAPAAWTAVATSIYPQAIILSTLLFAGCMLMHGELYRLRPPPQSLTTFYLCVSAGGALGGLFVGLLAPRIFSDYHELSAGMIACWTLVLLAWSRDRNRENAPPRRQIIAAANVVALLLFATGVGVQAAKTPDALIVQERNFFGVLRLLEFDADVPRRHRRNLRHGTTVHGMQFQSAEQRRLASAYFGRVTGIGLTLDSEPVRANRDIGIIGLGIGTLASYGRTGDRITFYEIDPSVVRFAQDSRYFTYLEDSAAEIRVVQGDARLALEDENKRNADPQYDVLVLDAFTGDAIPVHLLTRESLELYARHLRPDGFLAAHISNRYLDLTPLILRLGREVGLHGVKIVNQFHRPTLSLLSEWVVLGRDEKLIDDFSARAKRRTSEYGLDPSSITVERLRDRLLDRVPVWTDGYSDILGVLHRTRREVRETP